MSSSRYPTLGRSTLPAAQTALVAGASYTIMAPALKGQCQNYTRATSKSPLRRVLEKLYWQDVLPTAEALGCISMDNVVE
jgi:hypothetical protein